jgi:imidazole glycerol phosphate synthase subunit HisF
MRRTSGVTVEALEVVSSAIKIPLILGGGSGQLGDLDWLAAHRVRVALILFSAPGYGFSPMASSTA